MNLKRLFQVAALLIAVVFISQNVKQRVIFYPLSNTDNIRIDPYYTYDVVVCAQNGDKKANSIYLGFCDALNDQGVKHNLAFNINVNYSYTYSSIIFYLNKQFETNQDLFFTIGKIPQTATLSMHKDIPIVSAGTMDFSRHISLSSRSKEKRRFTGVSSLPNTEFLLSTIIEVVPYLDKVALIYGEHEDSEAIYQNSILKSMLEEANIKWKDYVVPAYEEDAESMTSTNKTHKEEEESLDELPSFIDVIEDASISCDCIFIPTNSTLSDNANIITDIALANNAITISNDPDIGLNTYCSTYTDPYDQGYIAGKQAYSILTEDIPVTDIEIADITWEKSFKLYNSNYLDRYPHEFPKSFSEINTFLSVYREGSKTSRQK